MLVLLGARRGTRFGDFVWDQVLSVFIIGELYTLDMLKELLKGKNVPDALVSALWSHKKLWAAAAPDANPYWDDAKPRPAWYRHRLPGAWPNTGHTGKDLFDYSTMLNQQRQIVNSENLPTGTCSSESLTDINQRMCTIDNLYDGTTYEFAMQEMCRPRSWFVGTCPPSSGVVLVPGLWGPVPPLHTPKCGPTCCAHGIFIA